MYSRGDVFEVRKLLYDDYGTELQPGCMIEIIDIHPDPSVEMFRFKQSNGSAVFVFAGRYLRHNCVQISSAAATSRPGPYQPTMTPSPTGYPGLPIPTSTQLASLELELPPGIKCPVTEQLASKCECGCASIGINNHSDYCPLFKRDTM